MEEMRKRKLARNAEYTLSCVGFRENEHGFVRRFIVLPAHPYDRRGVKIKALEWYGVAVCSKGCGVIVYWLMPKCVIWKNMLVTFTAGRFW
jgi:hypothetical protein